MLFQFTFRTRPNDLLPINYQYEMASWIYKTINQVDQGYAQFLHSDAYSLGNKHFKLFTFSHLRFPKYQIEGDRIRVLSQKAFGTFAFYIDRTAESFIKGLFERSKLSIGDRTSHVEWKIDQIETLDSEIRTQSIRFQTLSPLVVSMATVRNGKNSASYLEPHDPNFESRFLENLVNKYQALMPEKPIPDTATWKLRVLSPQPKAKLTKIKADTEQETQIKGYLFEFELDAPPDILRIGLLAGFGEKNALGFGCCRMMKGE